MNEAYAFCTLYDELTEAQKHIVYHHIIQRPPTNVAPLTLARSAWSALTEDEHEEFINNIL